MAKPLPPLNAVRAFEVAARHLNLSRAADELGVTQSAISKQVIALEDHIGAQLFERHASGLQLTQEGYTLKEALQPAFAMMQDAFVHYSRRGPRSTTVRITTLASFAAQFLIPRLDKLKQRHPDIEIELITGIRLVDLTKEEIDIAVRYGLGEYEGVNSSQLLPGCLAPVCAPEVQARGKGDVMQLLANTRRLQSAGFNEWREWSQLAGVDFASLPRAMQIEDFLVAIKSCLLRQSAAILPSILVHDHVQAGELVRFSPHRVETDHTFHLAHTTAALRRPAVKDVIDWLREEAAAVV